MTKQDYDGFTVTMFLDEDDQWLAHFVELQSVSACYTQGLSRCLPTGMEKTGLKRSWSKSM